MVETDIGILGRGGRTHPATQCAPRAIGIAVDQEAHHPHDIVLRPCQPVLQGEEVGTQVLSGAGNEAQNLRQTPQHAQLPCTSGGTAVLAAAQLLEEGQGPALRALHAQASHAGQADDLGCGHAGNHGIALLAPGLQPRQHLLDVILQEQHGDNDDVPRLDIGAATLPCRRVVGPLGRDVDRQAQAREVARQGVPRAVDRARQMAVEGDDDDAHRDALSGRSGLWHRRGYRW